LCGEDGVIMAYKKFEGEEVYFDYTDLKEKKITKFLNGIIKLLSYIIYKVDYVGLENIPKDGGFIMASNHVSIVDPGFLVITCDKVHFMAKGELFTNKFLAKFFRALNAFPVKRGNSDKSSVEYAINVIKQGKVLGVFPEGTCSDDGFPLQPKAGVSLIAKATRADVLPVAICTKNKGRLFQRVVIRIGEVIKYEDLGISDDKRSSSELRAAARLVMDRIVALWEQGPNARDRKKGGNELED